MAAPRRDPSPRVLRLAALLLCFAACARPPEAWRTDARAREPFTRLMAAVALGRSGSAEAAPELVRLLGDEEPQVRGAARDGLARLGAAAVPALVDAATIGPGDASFDDQAAEVFAGLGETAVEPLLNQLRGTDGPRRDERAAVAARALARLAPLREDVVAGLRLAASDDERPAARKAAREALVRALLRRAAAPDAALREAARRELAEQGRAALGGLVSALRSESPELVDAAVPALAALSPAVLPDLLAAVGERNPQHIAAVGRVVAAMGPEALPPLLAILGDPAHPCRVRAATALAGLGAQGAPAWPALLAALDDTQPNLPIAAALTLGRTPPPDEASLDALVDATSRHSAVVRELLLPAVVRGLADAWVAGGPRAQERLAQLAALGDEGRQQLAREAAGADPQRAARAASALGALR